MNSSDEDQTDIESEFSSDDASSEEEGSDDNLADDADAWHRVVDEDEQPPRFAFNEQPGPRDPPPANAR